MRQRSTWRVIATGAMGISALMIGGCAETLTGLGVAYAKGNLEAVVAADSANTVAAVESTFADLEISVTRTVLGPAKTTLIGRNPQHQRVKVKVKDRGAEASKVCVRIGTFGKRMTSHDIFDHIQSKLSAPEASTVVASH